MKFKNVAVVGALALSTVIALSACSAATTDPTATPTPTEAAFVIDPTLTGTLTAGGSSAQGNAQAAWTAAFKAVATGVTVNYDKSQGSGGGVTNFTAGSYDFAGSDSPLKPEQTTAAAAVCGADGAIDIPVYLDGISIVYNVKGVTSLKLTASTIAKIFSLQITDWSDAAITKDNGKALPAGPIQTVARSDGSGTTQNFTNYLSATVPTDWTFPASNKWPVAGNVSAQQGGSGIVNTVTAGEGTIGYADHSAIGSLNAVEVGVGSSFVAFSADGVAAAYTAATTPALNGVAGDMSQKFDYSKLTSGDVYPIPLVSYAVVCKTFATPAQAKLTAAYLGFITSPLGQKVAAKNAGSAPLPASISTAAATTIATIK
ncbi:MAG: phosphate ABC transporter substrate-binding protein PstS [Rhodoglobus sp.]